MILMKKMLKYCQNILDFMDYTSFKQKKDIFHLLILLLIKILMIGNNMILVNHFKMKEIYMK